MTKLQLCVALTVVWATWFLIRVVPWLCVIALPIILLCRWEEV